MKSLLTWAISPREVRLESGVHGLRGNILALKRGVALSFCWEVTLKLLF